MRIYDFEQFSNVVYLVRFSASGLVRRHADRPDAQTKVLVLGREIKDAVFMETCGGNDEFAAVEVIGTAITWGWGDESGMVKTTRTVMESTVWVHAGRIDGPIRDARIKIERAVCCDPTTGSTKVWSVQVPEPNVQSRRKANPRGVGQHQ